MAGVRRCGFLLIAMLANQAAYAVEPQHTRPSQTPNLSPQTVSGVFGYDTRRPLFHPQSTVDRLFHFPADRRAGGYRTDGPRVFDIFSIRPIKKSLHLEKGKKEEE